MNQLSSALARLVPTPTDRMRGLSWSVLLGLLPQLAVTGAQAAPPRIVSPTFIVNSLTDNLVDGGLDFWKIDRN